MQDSLCSRDYIEIAGKQMKLNHNFFAGFRFFNRFSGVGENCSQGNNAHIHSRLCGTIFNTIKDFDKNAPSVCGNYLSIRINDVPFKFVSFQDCTRPFTLEVVTDAAKEAIDPAAGTEQRGWFNSV